MVKQKLQSLLQNERGMALVLVLVVSTALALVGTSYLSTSTHEAGLVTEKIDNTQELYAAESGVGYARNQLKTSDNWTNTDWTGDISDGAGKTVTVAFVYDEPNNLGTITSTCDQQEIVVSVSRIIAPAASPFNQTVCSCSNIALVGSGGVDSYIYSGGVYTAQAGTGIASNGNIAMADQATISGDVVAGESIIMNGDWVLGGPAVQGNVQAGTDLSIFIGAIQGNVTAGGSAYDLATLLPPWWPSVPPATVSGNLTVGGITTITNVGGTTTQGASVPPVTPPCDCTAIDLTPLITEASTTNDNSNITDINPSLLSGTNFFIDGSDTITIPAGTYYFNSFQIADSAQVSISGQVIIYLSGSGPFNISGNGIANTADNVSNLKIYSDTTDNIYLFGNSDFAGTIYAPSGNFLTIGNKNIYGAILVDNFGNGGNTEMHYDASLPATGEPVGEGGEITVQTNSWSQN